MPFGGETQINTPVTGTGTSNEFDVSQLPEEYRTDPRKLVDDINTLRSQVEESAKYKDWYDTTWSPWYQANHEKFEQYNRALQSGSQPASGWGTPPDPAAASAAAHGVPPAASRWEPQPAPTLDFDDPEVTQKMFSTLWDSTQALRRELGEGTHQELQNLRQELAQRSEDVYRLMTLKEQADGLERAALYSHVGYEQKYDPVKIAQFARQNNIADFRTAADLMYRKDRERELEQRAYDRGRQEAEQAHKNQQVTTEMTSGPTLMFRPRGQSDLRGSKLRDAALAAMREQRAQRRAQAS
jgi:hypothetical protein